VDVRRPSRTSQFLYSIGRPAPRLTGTTDRAPPFDDDDDDDGDPSP